MNAKKYKLKRQNYSKVKPKFYENGNLNFLTARHEIKIDDL